MITLIAVDHGHKFMVTFEERFRRDVDDHTAISAA